MLYTMSRLAKFCVAMIVASGLPVAAQVVISGQVNYNGNAVPFAPIQVCKVTSTGTPCLPTAAIFYDYNLSIPAPNPTSSDQFGNYTYYAASISSPSFYEAQVTPVLGLTWSFVFSGGSSGGGGGAVSQIVAGTNVTISPSGGTGVVTVSSTGGGGGNGPSFPAPSILHYWNGDSRWLTGDYGASNIFNYVGNLPMQYATDPTLNGGSLNSGVLTITSCTTSSGITTLSYAGSPAPILQQIVALSGLTGANCAALNSSTATPYPLYYNVTSVGSGTFSFASSLANSTESQSGAVATLYGHVINNSTSSYQIVTAIADYPTKVHPFSPVVTGQKGYIFDNLGGTEVLNAVSLSTIESQLQTLWALYHSDGWIVVRATILPLPGNLFGCGLVGPCRQAGRDLNTWTVGQKRNVSISTPSFDYLVNADQLLPNVDDRLLYESDGIHPTSAGQAKQVSNFTSVVLNNSDGPAPSFSCFPSNSCASTGANFFNGQQMIQYSNGSDQGMLDVSNTSSDGTTNTISITQDSATDIRWAFGSGGTRSYFCQHGGGLDDKYLTLASNGCDPNHDTKFYRSGFTGDPTAPSGSCPVTGVWQLSGDGKISFCKSGTWEVVTTAP